MRSSDKTSAPSNMPSIRINQLNYRYGKRHVLQNIDAQFNFGEVTGIFGENGAGKTTLLKILAGIHPGGTPESGVWHHLLVPQTRANAPEAAQQLGARDERQRPQFRGEVGYLGQQVQPAWALKVRALVELGTLSRPTWNKEEKQQAIASAMQQTDCAHLAERKVSEISTGELQRALLARVLAGKPKVILADEPTTGLDPRHQLAVMQLLRAHARAGGMVIVVMHDLRLGQEFCDNALLLANNTVYQQGPCQQVLTPENIYAVFGV